MGSAVSRRFVLGAMLAGVALPVWADAPAAGSRFAAPLGRLARVMLGAAAVAVAERAAS